MGLNPLITGSMILESLLTFWDKWFFFATDCGNLLKWLLEFMEFKSYLWTGPWIGVGFEYKSLLHHVYVLSPIDMDLTIDSNDPDEPYSEIII